VKGWRIVKRSLAEGAFTGEGARLYGGRWNSPGRPVVYLGGSPGIAALEVLAHNARPALLSAKFVIIEVTLPPGSVLNLDATNLPEGWNDPDDHSLAAAIGDAWLDSGDSLALRVPSAVLPLERNLVVNVQHPQFGEVATAVPQAFAFDPRLR
jgi:RES domain-containing protein